MTRFGSAFIIAVFAVSPGAAQSDDDVILKKYTDDFVEKLMRDIDPSFKKGRDRVNNSYWDFKVDKYKARLTNFGQDMMLDAIFGKISIDTANRWNQSAKFSRVVLYNDNDKTKKAYSAIESNLDCAGGVSANIVRNWIKRFESEVKRYAKFVRKTEVTEKVYPRITPQLIEDVLRDLNLNFRQAANQNKVVIYTFTNRDNFNLLLYIFDSKDIMIAANFPATTLEKINKYNLDRKFVRAVLYKGKQSDYTSLECNLDCIAGVSPSMIRYFVNTFNVDLRDFAKKLFNSKQQ